MRSVRLALAQYPIDELDGFDAYAEKITRWVREAAGNGAQLLVFPEYGSMELASFLPRDQRGDLAASIAGLQACLPQVDALHTALAREHRLHILAASAPVLRADGRYVNVARLFAPSGKIGRQEKRVMTRFEREQWHIAPGAGLCVFNTALGTLAVAICYDCEFPLLVRALAEAGAQIVLVPSCTDGLAGYHRVRMSAQARALENQCYVAMSPTVGEARWSPAVDTNRGAAGVFAPADRFMPDNGVIAEGVCDKAMWLYADVDLDLLTQVRRQGQVFNYRHWDDQPGHAMIEKAIQVDLS